jgi:capsid protein
VSKPNIKLKADAMTQHAGTLAPMRGGQAFNARVAGRIRTCATGRRPGSADADILPELPIIRRARATSTRNHGVAGGALQTQLDNVLGCGLWLAPTPDYVLLGKTREWASEWRDR